MASRKKQTILLLSAIKADGTSTDCKIEKLEDGIIVVKADKDSTVKIEYNGTDSLEAMSKMQENKNLTYFLLDK